MTFEEWAQYGYDQGWCGPPVCYTHDDFPATSQEHDELYEGDEPCMQMIRLYDTDEQRRQIEDIHAASMWRASNLGWIKLD